MEKLYLINGDDDFSKLEAIENIKSGFSKLEKGISFLQFDKDNIDKLGAELTTYSFFQDEKLIIVKVPPTRRSASSNLTENDEEAEETESTVKDWLSDDLKEQILNKIETITLVFVEDGSPKSKINNFVSANGEIINCTKKKPYEVAKWVVSYAKNLKMIINSQDANLLVDLCGANKHYIANELSKLYDYKGEKTVITSADINLLCPKTPEVTIFELTDYFGAKNKTKALEKLDELLDNKEPIQKIFIMIAKHFKNILIAKYCIEQNRDITKTLEFKSSYPAIKLKEQAANFSKEELVNLFKKFAELDINSKTGLIDLKIGLQQILLT